MKKASIQSGLVFLLLLMSYYPVHAKSILEGRLSKGTADLLDNGYGQILGKNVFQHPWPLIQQFEESVFTSKFKKECEKFSNNNVGEKPTQDCVDCKTEEIKPDLISEEDFKKISSYVKDSQNVPGTTLVSKDPISDHERYAQWIWLNRAIEVQKQGMESSLPFIEKLQGTLAKLTAGRGNSKLMDVPNPSEEIGYIKVAEHNIAEIAVIEGELRSKRSALTPEQKEDRMARRNELLRETPLIGHPDIRKIVAEAGGEYEDNTDAAHPKGSPERIRAAVKSKFPQIYRAMAENAKTQLAYFKENIPKLSSYIKDRDRLQKSYRESEGFDAKWLQAKEALDAFIGGSLHAQPLLRLTSSTDPGLVKAFEKAGCQIKERTKRNEGEADATLLLYSAAVGGWAAKAASVALPVVLPNLSQAALRAASVAANVPPAFIDYGANLKIMGERCKALGSQIASGKAGTSKGDDSDILKDYQECLDNESTTQKLTAAGYGIGVVGTLFTRVAVKAAKPAVQKMLEGFKNLTAEERDQIAEFAGPILAKRQAGATGAVADDFQKRMAAIAAQIKAQNPGISESELTRKVEAQFTKEAAAAAARDQKAFLAQLDDAVKNCPTGGAATGWADEIGMPWLTSSIGLSTQQDPLRELFPASL